MKKKFHHQKNEINKRTNELFAYTNEVNVLPMSLVNRIFFWFWYRKNFVNNFIIYEMQISEGFLRIDLKRLFRYLKPPHAISNKKYLTVLFVSISIEGLHRNISVN